MATDINNDTPARIRSLVGSGRITHAMIELEAFAQSSSSSWDIKNEIQKLRENFNLLSKFALDGFDDPTRGEMIADITGKMLMLADRISRDNASADNPSVYFSTLRYDRMQSDSLSSLKDKYDELLSRYSMSRYGFSLPDKSGGVTRSEIEQLETRIFESLWVTFPLSKRDVGAVGSLLRSESTPKAMQRLVLSALYLGGQYYFDPSRLELLAEIYSSAQDSDISVQALCELLLLVWQWRKEKFPKPLTDRLTVMADDHAVALDIRMVFLQLIRTIDTKRITREVNEELIPKMRNISPDLRKLNELQEMAFDSPEANPQWQEILRDSGIEEQLKKLNDMQTEGADVMMSPFSHLKTFPFFSSVVNWFRPFDSDRPEFADMPQEIFELLAQTPFLCDSDKYSMAFSMSGLPSAMRGMVKQQLSAMNIDLAESASKMYVDKDRRMVATNFLQNIYRFFNLYRRKGDFHNPFAEAIDLFEIESLRPALNDVQTIAAIAEFHLKNGYYREALSNLSRLPEEEIFFSSDLLQKVGFCRQKTGDYEGAIDAYSKSELLDGRNKWTLRRLAFCHKALGHTAEALGYFRRLLEMSPDDVRLNLSAAHCLMESGDYADAMKLYYKVEFIDETTDKTLRPIAWCAFLMHDFDKARTYYERVLLDNPTATDYLNYGHFLLSDGKPREASNAYVTALQLFDNDFSRFNRAFVADSCYLDRFDVDPLLRQLVVDSVEASIWKNQ